MMRARTVWPEVYGCWLRHPHCPTSEQGKPSRHRRDRECKGRYRIIHHIIAVGLHRLHCGGNDRRNHGAEFTRQRRTVLNGDWNYVIHPTETNAEIDRAVVFG